MTRDLLRLTCSGTGVSNISVADGTSAGGIKLVE